MLILALIFLASCLLGLVFFAPAVRFIERVPQTLLFFVVLFSIYTNLAFEEAVALGAINVSPMDLASVVLLALSAPFFLNRIRTGFTRREVVLLYFLGWTVLLFLNFALGVREFGLQPATNEFRSYLYVIAVAIFVATRDIDFLWPRIEQVFLVGAAILLVFALVGFADGDFSREGRPLPANHALLMLQAAWIGLFMHEAGRLRRHYLPLILVFLPVVVILQHRSVWVVLVVSGVLVARFLRRTRATFVRAAVAGAAVLAVVGFAVFGGAIFNALGESYEEATTTSESGQGSTFLWRIEGWSGLLWGEQMDSLSEVCVGNAFGTGWDREITTGSGAKAIVEASPHNYYVQTTLRSGVLGLLLFVCVYYLLIVRLLRRAAVDADRRLVFQCLAVLLICQLIYFIPYSADPVQAILLGAGLGFIREPPDRSEIAVPG